VIKKLARETPAKGLLVAETAASIDRVVGVKQAGVRASASDSPAL